MESAAEQATRDILNLETHRVESTIAADVDALDKLFADDLVWIHANGGIDNKEQWLGKVGSGAVKYTQMTSEETKVRLYENSAVVTGEGLTSFENKAGARTMQVSYTAVYHLFGNEWRTVSMQVTARA